MEKSILDFVPVVDTTNQPLPGKYAYKYKDKDGSEITMTFQTMEEMKAYVAEITKES